MQRDARSAWARGGPSERSLEAHRLAWARSHRLPGVQDSCASALMTSACTRSGVMHGECCLAAYLPGAWLRWKTASAHVKWPSLQLISPAQAQGAFPFKDHLPCH